MNQKLRDFEHPPRLCPRTVL